MQNHVNVAKLFDLCASTFGIIREEPLHFLPYLTFL